MGLVLLDEARKSPEYIKKRLRWLVDSFRMYLRDTALIQHQHVDALLAASQEVMNLIATLPEDVIALSTMTKGMDDPDMNEYVGYQTNKFLLPVMPVTVSVRVFFAFIICNVIFLTSNVIFALGYHTGKFSLQVLHSKHDVQFQ